MGPPPAPKDYSSEEREQREREQRDREQREREQRERERTEIPPPPPPPAGEPERAARKMDVMRTMMMRLMRTRRVVLRRLQHRDLVRLLEKLRRHHQRVRMAMSMALQTANQRWKSRLTIRFFLLLVMTVDDSVEVLYCSSNKL